MEEAIASGVDHFFIPAIDSTYVQRMYALEAAYPDQYSFDGWFTPYHVKENFLEEIW